MSTDPGPIESANEPPLKSPARPIVLAILAAAVIVAVACQSPATEEAESSSRKRRIHQMGKEAIGCLIGPGGAARPNPLRCRTLKVSADLKNASVYPVRPKCKVVTLGETLRLEGLSVMKADERRMVHGVVTLRDEPWRRGQEFEMSLGCR